jgi:hypothetical protein
MNRLVFVVSIMLTAVGMGLSLAHALELPGKLRLDEATYRKVQTIYYPGFTIGGAVGEFGALLAVLALMLLVPIARPGYWLVVVAFGLLLMAHAVYWLVTHRANKAWLKDEKLSGAGKSFFGVGGSERKGSWTELRDVWELSHVARASLQLTALLLLVLAAVPRHYPG